MRRIDSVREELGAKIEALRLELTSKIETLRIEVYALKGSIATAKIWALLLYFALASSLLLVMARGFHWL
jgi:hypothetical protein